MIRSPIRRRPKDAPPRPKREETFASVVIERPAARMASNLAAELPRVAVPQKLPREVRVKQSIRDAARNEECTVRIVGVCNFDPATSVWSHLPALAGGRGLGIKSIDEAGAISCSRCHDVMDGRAPIPPGATRESVLLDWFFGHMRSLVRLKQKGAL